MRSPYALLVVGLIAGIVRGQAPTPAAWIRSHFPDLRTVTVQSALAEAQRTGFVTSPAEELAFKNAYQQVRGKGRWAAPAFKSPVQTEVKGVRPLIATDNVFEHETNDGWQYADDMAGQVATGSVLTAGDVDSWRFHSTGAFYTFEVLPTGLNPIADSWLTLRNFKGDPIANDDNGGLNGLLSRINIYLPAGTYYLDVAGYESLGGAGGGDYNLVAQSDAASVVPLTSAGGAGVTRIPVGGFAHDVFQFSVPEGSVNLQVDSAGNDTALMIQRADGVVLFSNDDSTVGGLDAAADIDLPAGTYYAYVWDVLGTGGVPFSLSMADTPGALPDLVALLQTVSSIGGDESLRLGRITLNSPARIDVMTEDGPVLPVGDTVMTLLDRDLDFCCDVDDDDFFNRGGYSRIAMNLPAGTYYIGVTGFTGFSGDFTITAITGPQLPSGAAAFGDTPTTIPGFGEIATYTLSNHSQASIQVRGSDFWFGILGPDGELATNTRCSLAQPQVGELPAGDSTLFVWDRFDYTGPLTATIVPPLYMVGTEVLSRAKLGDIVFLFLNNQGYTAGFNFGAGDRGLFCLPFGPTLMTYSDRTPNVDGVASWGFVPPGLTGLQLQSGDLHMGIFEPIPAIGTWRNCLDL